MNATEMTFALPPQLSSRGIRAVVARLAHPSDPLADWNSEVEEWIKAIQEFRSFETAAIIGPVTPHIVHLRQHRFVLHTLMALGEELVLDLIKLAAISDSERHLHTEHVDGFLAGLRDSWHTWHGESLPEHRQMLAPFLRSA